MGGEKFRDFGCFTVLLETQLQKHFWLTSISMKSYKFLSRNVKLWNGIQSKQKLSEHWNPTEKFNFWKKFVNTISL